MISQEEQQKRRRAANLKTDKIWRDAEPTLHRLYEEALVRQKKKDI